MFLTDFWFWAFLITALILCFSLGHNITSGAKLKTQLTEAIEAKWALLQAALVQHKADTAEELHQNALTRTYAQGKADAEVSAGKGNLGVAGSAAAG